MVFFCITLRFNDDFFSLFSMNIFSSHLYRLPPPVLPIARPRAQALFAYQAQNNDELSLQPSQFITVLEKMSDGWWRGELDDGKMGMFPHNYVKVRKEEIVIMF